MGITYKTKGWVGMERGRPIKGKKDLMIVSRETVENLLASSSRLYFYYMFSLLNQI